MLTPRLVGERIETNELSSPSSVEAKVAELCVGLLLRTHTKTDPLSSIDLNTAHDERSKDEVQNERYQSPR